MSDDLLIADIIDNRRSFLPGGAEPNSDDLRASMDGNILLAGLSRPEAKLVLSTLPKGATRVYFSPLDKGLSEAKVFSGRYQIDSHRLSKAFVFKIGPRYKIMREYDAVERFVTPFIGGISRPVYRANEHSSLIVQDFAGLYQAS